jgi:hypothetical protein
MSFKYTAPHLGVAWRRGSAANQRHVMVVVPDLLPPSTMLSRYVDTEAVFPLPSVYLRRLWSCVVAHPRLHQQVVWCDSG